MKTQPRSSRAQSSSSGYGSASSRTFTSPPEWATTHSSSRRQAAVRVGDHEYMRADAIGIMATPERTSNAIAPPSAVVVITAQRADRWRHLPCSQALNTCAGSIRSLSRVNQIEEDDT